MKKLLILVVLLVPHPAFAQQFQVRQDAEQQYEQRQRQIYRQMQEQQEQMRQQQMLHQQQEQTRIMQQQLELQRQQQAYR